MNNYDYDDNAEWDSDDIEELNAFIEYLKQAEEEYYSEPRMRILNPRRLKEFQYALMKITKIIKKASPDAKIEYDLDDGFSTGHGAIRIETDELSVKNPQQLIDSIKFASDVDIFPLTNGNIKIILGFRGMMDEFKTEE